MQSGQRRGRWSGVPLESRQAVRRDNLIAAGVQLLGGDGGPALTVRAVCREAALTERYFYESFSDRDEFVRAVYDDVCARAMAALTSAKTPREAVEQFVALMVDDPVRGRVLLLAPAVEPILTRSGAEWMPNFIDLLQRKLSRIGDPVLAENGRHQPDRRPDSAVHRLPERAAGGHPRTVHRLLRRHAAQHGCISTHSRATGSRSTGSVGAARLSFVASGYHSGTRTHFNCATHAAKLDATEVHRYIDCNHRHR